MQQSTPSSYSATIFLENTNFTGGDIAKTAAADPLTCHKDCLGNYGCKAWTWVKPTSSTAASCILKNTVPKAIPDVSSTSGVKPLDMDYNTSRPVTAYRTFFTPSPDPQVCKDACLADSKCKTWNYQQPGISKAGLAACQLSEAVASKKAEVGVISGMKGNVYQQTPGVGNWGGKCTCPDGQEYYVGDNADACKSLACDGGISGSCSESGANGKGGWKVTCGSSNGNVYQSTGISGMAWGGKCTCPDGRAYLVGDNNDACKSIACVGGTPGTCTTDAALQGGKAGWKVTCGTVGGP